MEAECVVESTPVAEGFDIPEDDASGFGARGIACPSINPVFSATQELLRAGSDPECAARRCVCGRPPAEAAGRV